MRIASVALVLGIVGSLARAEPLTFTASATDAGPPVSQTVVGSDLAHLIGNLVNQSDEFGALSGRSYTASIGVLGVNNAFRLDGNASGTSTTLTIGATGFTRTFTGATSEEVEAQVESFLKSDGPEAYAAYVRSINELSAAAPIDGNPQALTAWLNAGAFSRFAFNPIVDTESAFLGKGAGFDVVFEGGSATTDHGDITILDLALQGAGRINDSVAITWALPFGVHTIDGTESYLLGFELGLPITVVKPRPAAEDRSVSWRITPFGQVGGGLDADLVLGGVIAGGGVNSALNFRFRKTIFTIGNQVAYLGGIPIDYDEYSFDSSVDQVMLRNGVLLTHYLGSSSSFIDVGVAYTNLLNEAAIPNYVSPTLGFGFRFGSSHASGVRIAYQGDFADGYSGNNGNVSLFLNW